MQIVFEKAAEKAVGMATGKAVGMAAGKYYSFW